METAVQAPASRDGQIAKSGLFGWKELVLPFHFLFARISNRTYLEFLRHNRSPCAASFAVPFNFVRFKISAEVYRRWLFAFGRSQSWRCKKASAFGQRPKPKVSYNWNIELICLQSLSKIASFPVKSLISEWSTYFTKERIFFVPEIKKLQKWNGYKYTLFVTS